MRCTATALGELGARESSGKPKGCGVLLQSRNEGWQRMALPGATGSIEAARSAQACQPDTTLINNLASS